MESNRLSYMSVASKIKVCQALTPIGCISINEVREMFGYAGVLDGDTRQVSLNYVKAADQSAYQTGKDSTEGGDNDDETENDADNESESDSAGGR